MLVVQTARVTRPLGGVAPATVVVAASKTAPAFPTILAAQLPDCVAPIAAAEIIHGLVPCVAEIAASETGVVPWMVAVVIQGEVP